MIWYDKFGKFTFGVRSLIVLDEFELENINQKGLLY